MKKPDERKSVVRSSVGKNSMGKNSVARISEKGQLESTQKKQGGKADLTPLFLKSMSPEEDLTRPGSSQKPTFFGENLQLKCVSPMDVVENSEGKKNESIYLENGDYEQFKMQYQGLIVDQLQQKQKNEALDKIYNEHARSRNHIQSIQTTEGTTFVLRRVENEPGAKKKKKTIIVRKKKKK